MSPIVRMFLFLAAAGFLAAFGGSRLDEPVGWILVGLAMIAMAIGVYNFYLHARTKWPFRRKS